MRFALTAAAALLAGCATMSNPRDLADDDLCARYGRNIRANDAQRAAELRAEMDTRQLRIDEDDVAFIRKALVRVGMTTCAMHASWGIPSISNRTTTAGDVRVQHVWRGVTGQYVRTQSSFVYTQGGRVVAIQN